MFSRPLVLLLPLLLVSAACSTEGDDALTLYLSSGMAPEIDGALLVGVGASLGVTAQDACRGSKASFCGTEEVKRTVSVSIAPAGIFALAESTTMPATYELIATAAGTATLSATVEMEDGSQRAATLSLAARAPTHVTLDVPCSMLGEQAVEPQPVAPWLVETGAVLQALPKLWDGELELGGIIDFGSFEVNPAERLRLADGLLTAGTTAGDATVTSPLDASFTKSFRVFSPDEIDGLAFPLTSNVVAVGALVTVHPEPLLGGRTACGSSRTFTAKSRNTGVCTVEDTLTSGEVAAGTPFVRITGVAPGTCEIDVQLEREGDLNPLVETLTLTVR